MPRKVISIIFYVVAGFFVYMVSLLAFVNMDSLPSADKPPSWIKLVIVGIFFVPALVSLAIGLLISRFQHWKRDIGIVMVSGAGMTTFLIFTMACLLLSPESRKFFPPDKLSFFSDFITGTTCLVLLIVLGVALIMISKREVPDHTLVKLSLEK